MPGGLSMRLLSVLQLTRMALVFTAIADGACSLLLLWRGARVIGRDEASVFERARQAGERPA